MNDNDGYIVMVICIPHQRWEDWDDAADPRVGWAIPAGWGDLIPAGWNLFDCSKVNRSRFQSSASLSSSSSLWWDRSSASINVPS